MSYLFIVAGFLLLVVGADYFVRGAVWLSRTLGVSSLLIGLTVVAWGTSLPELAVSLGSASRDAAGLAFGNILGSNIANVLLIGGVASILIPLACPRGELRRDAIILAATSVLALCFVQFGVLSRLMGAALLLILLAQTALIFRAVRQGEDVDLDLPDDADAAVTRVKIALFTIGGLLAVLVGGELLINGALKTARIWGVSEATIGLSLVAIGTSLPELATSIAAARQRQAGMIIGNIVGSNIANLVLVLGSVALLTPSLVPQDLRNGDVWLALATSGAFLGLLILGRAIGPRIGLGFLAIYALYLGINFYLA